jgi:hypothetical protein
MASLDADLRRGFVVPMTKDQPEAALEQVFEQAAQISVERDVDLEEFMSAAWEAYVDARPGYRDHLELQHTLERIDELRREGKIAQA